MNFEKIHRWLAYIWVAGVLLILGALAWLLPGAKLNTDIMDLLPRSEEPGVPVEITEACIRRLNQQLVWLVAAPSGSTSTDPAQWWLEQLRTLPEIGTVSGPADEAQQKAWGTFLFQYRAQVLDPEIRAKLERDPKAWAQWVISQVYSPFSGVSAAELKNDPLLLTRSRQMFMQNQSGPLTISDGWLTSTDSDGRQWRLIYGELGGSSFDISSTRALTAKLKELETELNRRWPGCDVLQRGTIFYSDYAANQSEADISRLGTFSFITVTLSIFLFFRSFRPLVLTMISTTVGSAAGVVALLLMFDSVHLVSLVLSTSVIGVAVDYALHVLTERMMREEGDSVLDGVRKLLPTISLALLTSALAYLMLAIAPFPGFRQLATYAIVGLAGAYLTVVLWFPFLAKKLPRRTPAGVKLAQGWVAIWRQRKIVRWGVPIIVLGVGLAGLSLLHPDDDIAKLQGFPPEFQANEKRIASLTGQGGDMSWYIVHGSDRQETLERVEGLESVLGGLKSDKKISAYRLISGQIPSMRRQLENFAAVAGAMPVVLGELEEAELDLKADTALRYQPLQPADWVSSPVSQGWRLLWFDLPDGEAAALVPVNGVVDNALMATIVKDMPGIHWLNRRAQLSELFSIYRQLLSKLLVLSLAVIAIIFSLRFGLRRGLRNTVPVLLAVGASLGALAFTGQTLNLFAMLALVLVLGIGIDYTLFFSNEACSATVSMMAVFIDVVTTLLSFGMLALSSTPAIAGFGVVLTTGIFTAFLLAPLAQSEQKES